MNYYLAALKKYAMFKGRAGRTEYWRFVLLNVTFGFGAYVLDCVFRTPSRLQVDLANFLIPGLLNVTSVFVGIYLLAVFVPFLAVAVRRLHDTGASGWWCLLGVIPVVGQILLVLSLATRGSPEDNRYGPAMTENLDAYQPLRYIASD